MNLDDFRLEMESYRNAVDKEARALKDSYLALDRLSALYHKFNSDEREMADKVINDWILSDDEGLRFDALSLVNQFKIKTAIPTLRILASRLASSTEPGAPYELEKVARLIQGLIRQQALPG